MALHFRHPLSGEPLGRHHQGAPDETAQFQFAHDQTGLDGLAETYLIGQEIANAIAGNGARQRMELVWKWNDVGFHRRQQDGAMLGGGPAFQNLGDLGGRRDICDAMRFNDGP